MLGLNFKLLVDAHGWRVDHTDGSTTYLRRPTPPDLEQNEPGC